MLVAKEKLHCQYLADYRFDSNKNWSIMINDESNDERNEIMRRFMFE